MNRAVTNAIRYLMDEWIPPAIRDSRWFMYPFFWFWFKGKKVRLYMDFKERAWKMTEEEFLQCYRELDCRATDRPTDLNKKSIEQALAAMDPQAESLLDVACGRGHWLHIVKQKRPGMQVTGTDVFQNPLTPGYDYVQGKIEALPFPDKSFDVVTCHHTIEHIRDLDKALGELKRVARKQVIVVTPRQRYFYFTMDLHLHFFPEAIDLARVMRMENYQLFLCGGDWCYVGRA